MKPIYETWLIQVEITNACIFKCAHCTRAIRHYSKYYFADLKFIEKALQSLQGWKKGVGCMSGEPTLHPKFIDICKLYNKYFPKNQCGLWTSGGSKYEKYKEIINETFGIINYNDHLKNKCYHRPLMVASEEVIPDGNLRNKLIDNCWLQKYWSPAITFKGAFFCEVAATFDMLFQGPGGYPIDKGWWKKTPKEFRDQIERYCKLCSIPLPLKSCIDTLDYDYVSLGNAKKLKLINSPLAMQNRLRIINRRYSRKDIKKMEEKNLRSPWQYSNKSKHYWFIPPKDFVEWKKYKEK